MDITLRRLGGDYFVAKAEQISPQLVAALSGSLFWTVSKTDLEASIVSELASHSSFSKVEGPWTVFGIVGHLDFSLTGVLSRCSGILAEKRISLFAVSTFDTDYFLVRKEAANAAADAWAGAGVSIQDDRKHHKE